MTETHWHDWVHVVGVGSVCECGTWRYDPTWQLRVHPNHAHGDLALLTKGD
jgi:hypothetical protein